MASSRCRHELCVAMRKTHLCWNPASDTPIVSPKRWLFFAYRFDGRTYITVGYYGESIELAKGKSAYCVWPGSPLLPEAKVVGWLDLEQVFNARVTKCMIRAADRLPPWSNRTVSSMFAYLGRFRMHPFLIRLHGTNEWDWAYWGRRSEKRIALGPSAPKNSGIPSIVRTFMRRARHTRRYTKGRMSITGWTRFAWY